MHFQDRFAQALLSPSSALPEGLTCWSGEAPVKRFNIYRSNVFAGLVQALAVRFPITQKIVGEEFFAAMAGEFVRSNPPRSPVLLDYGENFESFVAGFAPARSVSYLADIVRLENAQVKAYHAADRAPLDPKALSHLSLDMMERVRFRPHPSVSIVKSDHPIVTIWSMNNGDTALVPIERWEPEHALVVRPHLSVITRHLLSGGSVFLECLAAGATLRDATEIAWSEAKDFDLAAHLLAAFNAGVFISIETPAC